MSRKRDRRGQSQGRHLFKAPPQPHAPASPERNAEFIKELEAVLGSSLTEQDLARADELLRKAQASPSTPRLASPARAETRKRIAGILKRLQLAASNRQIAKTNAGEVLKEPR